MSVVRKLVPPKFKRSIKDYFALYRSGHVTKERKVRLTEKTMRYVIRQRQKGKSSSRIAAEIGISARYVRMVWAKFQSTGTIAVLHKAGRPKKAITQDMITEVLDHYTKMPAGVVRLACRIRETNQEISFRDVYSIMKSENMVTPSPAKSKKRKWVRYERRYSNAMWHVDWHMIKDSRLKGRNLIVFLDDASRCVTGFGVFQDATSENATLALRRAISEYTTPAQMLSDNGRCFAGGKAGGPKKRWTPTAFEEELLANNIMLITTRPYHPQTNGKLERFFRTFESEFVHFDRVDEFMEFYNERKTHFSLDIKNGQTPLKALHDKKVPEAIRKNNPAWMEEDAND